MERLRDRQKPVQRYSYDPNSRIPPPPMAAQQRIGGSRMMPPPNGNMMPAEPRGSAMLRNMPPQAPVSIPMSMPTQYSQPMYFSRASNISELVQVPQELTSFAGDPQFQQILLKVKEQTRINFISLNRSSDHTVDSVAIDAPTKEAAQLARNLIETHFKLQLKLHQAELRLQKVQTDLFAAQGEIASGMMLDFDIGVEFVGLAIGKKGARIKQIQEECGVSSINVDGETGRIVIVGPDSNSVQEARDLMEIVQQFIPLEDKYFDWLMDRAHINVLNDMKTVSDLIVCRLDTKQRALQIIGTKTSVRSASFVLNTQFEYMDKQIEIELSEQSAWDRLKDMRKQYGLGGGGRGPRPGGGGDRRDSNDRRRDNNSRDNNRDNYRDNNKDNYRDNDRDNYRDNNQRNNQRSNISTSNNNRGNNGNNSFNNSRKQSDESEGALLHMPAKTQQNNSNLKETIAKPTEKLVEKPSGESNNGRNNNRRQNGNKSDNQGKNEKTNEIVKSGRVVTKVETPETLEYKEPPLPKREPTGRRQPNAKNTNEKEKEKNESSTTNQQGKSNKSTENKPKVDYEYGKDGNLKSGSTNSNSGKGKESAKPPVQKEATKTNTRETAKPAPKPVTPKQTTKENSKESSKPSAKETSTPAPKENAKPAAKPTADLKETIKTTAKPTPKEKTTPVSKPDVGKGDEGKKKSDGNVKGIEGLTLRDAAKKKG